jgi:hypothetical protein
VDGYSATARVHGYVVAPRRPGRRTERRLAEPACDAPELVDLGAAAPPAADTRLARLAERLDDSRAQLSQLTWYLFSEDAWR